MVVFGTRLPQALVASEGVEAQFLRWTHILTTLIDVFNSKLWSSDLEKKSVY